MNAVHVSTADSDSGLYLKSNAVDLKKTANEENIYGKWRDGWKKRDKEKLSERNKQQKLRLWEEEQSSSSSYQNVHVICSAQVFFLDKPKFMISTTAPV